MRSYFGDFEAPWLDTALTEVRLSSFGGVATVSEWLMETRRRGVLNTSQFFELINRRIAVASRHEGGRLQLLPRLYDEGFRTGNMRELIGQLTRDGKCADYGTRLLFGTCKGMPEKNWPIEIQLAFLMLRLESSLVFSLSIKHFWVPSRCFSLEHERQGFIGIELYPDETLALEREKWRKALDLFV